MTNSIFYLDPAPSRSPFFLKLQALPKPLYAAIGLVFFIAISWGYTQVMGMTIGKVQFAPDPQWSEFIRLAIFFGPLWLYLFIYAIGTKSFRGTGFTSFRAVRRFLVGLVGGLAIAGVGYVPSILAGQAIFNGHMLGQPVFWFTAFAWLFIVFVQTGGEEVVYRGLLPRFLGRRLNAAWSIILPTVSFTAVHIFVNNAVATMILALGTGLTFGMLCVLTNSIWPSIGTHLGINYVSLFLISASPTALIQLTAQPTVLGIILILASPLVLAVIYFFVVKAKRPGWSRERIGDGAALDVEDRVQQPA